MAVGVLIVNLVDTCDLARVGEVDLCTKQFFVYFLF